ncbi:MAG: flagellar basal body P-ring formation protein FlgA [Pigmentiphaga sp.]|nr:flagellar basal body P-ring formation protein FlgA [Pigmentiphaga sp.]
MRSPPFLPVVRPAALLARLRAGLFLAVATAASTTTAATDAETTTAISLVREQVAAAVRAHAAGWPGTLSLDIDLQGLERFAPCAAPHASLPPTQRLRSRLSVAVRCDAPERWQTYVQVRVDLHGPYLVAARTLEQGQLVGPDAIEAREGDLLALPRGALHDRDLALGRVATRRIGAGQLLRDNALRSADAVQRGQTVRLIVRGNGFVASSEGEALDSAEPGSPLQVRTASGQVVGGIVMPGGVVEIPL